MSEDPLLDRQAKAAYERCMKTYGGLPELPPEYLAMIHAFVWEGTDETTRERWREIVRAALAVR